MSRQIDEKQSVVRFALHKQRPFFLLSLSACCAFAAFYGLVGANDGLTAANEKPTGADEEKRLFARDAMSAATPKNACVWCKKLFGGDAK